MAYSPFLFRARARPPIGIAKGCGFPGVALAKGRLDKAPVGCARGAWVRRLWTPQPCSTLYTWALPTLHSSTIHNSFKVTCRSSPGQSRAPSLELNRVTRRLRANPSASRNPATVNTRHYRSAVLGPLQTSSAPRSPPVAGRLSLRAALRCRAPRR